jgi:GTP-binding protein HflX
LISTRQDPPRALLLVVQTPDLPTEASLEESLLELRELAMTAGCVVVDEMVSRGRIHAGTFLGQGKLEEARERALVSAVDVVIFDNDLSPSQSKKVEEALKVVVLDRTQLILEIFRAGARTHEARAQVELAHLEYMLPRLAGMWAHLDRERGGIAGSKGAGEKQIDIDRSLIRHRIARLKKELRQLAQERDTQKKTRANCFRVSLVGYTNAGKSTLMNRLTDAGVAVENKLFATLDSTTRILLKHQQPRILLSDTVGFIRRLPHQLVASFRSTLEVAKDADLLLHVVDLSHPAHAEHIGTTEQVLTEIGAQGVPRLLVFNKLDLVDKVTLTLARHRYPDAVLGAALSGEVEPLRARIGDFFDQSMVTTPLRLAYAHSRELAKIYKWSRVDEVRYEQDGIHLTITSTPVNLRRLQLTVPESAGTAADGPDAPPQEPERSAPPGESETAGPASFAEPEPGRTAPPPPAAVRASSPEEPKAEPEAEPPPRGRLRKYSHAGSA